MVLVRSLNPPPSIAKAIKPSTQHQTTERPLAKVKTKQHYPILSFYPFHIQGLINPSVVIHPPPPPPPLQKSSSNLQATTDPYLSVSMALR